MLGSQNLQSESDQLDQNLDLQLRKREQRVKLKCTMKVGFVLVWCNSGTIVNDLLFIYLVIFCFFSTLLLVEVLTPPAFSGACSKKNKIKF